MLTIFPLIPKNIKNKIMPIKSITLEKIEQMQKQAAQMEGKVNRVNKLNTKMIDQKVINLTPPFPPSSYVRPFFPSFLPPDFAWIIRLNGIFVSTLDQI